MNRFPVRTLLFPLLALSFLLPLQGAEAASPAAAAETKCDFGGDIVALRAAEAAASAGGEEEATSTAPAPLFLRRDILVKIADCALGEAAALEAGVKKVPPAGNDGKRLAALLMGRITTITADYETAKAKIGTADEDGLRGVAREIAAARREQYLPIWDMSRAYVVWSTNRELLERAEKRLADTKQTLAARKLIADDRVAGAIERASVNVLRAREADYRAMQSIERFERERVLVHFKDTLDNLHGMYQALLDLSAIVKTIR